jgi:hypothetical protein
MTRYSLIESIADKQSVNFQIERILRGHEPAMQTKLLDALELVKDAGTSGVAVGEWAAKIKQLYPDEDFSIVDLLKTAVREFGCCIKRLGDKRYGWSEEDDTALVTADPATRAAMSGQMQLAKITMDTMKELSEFTAEELGTAVADKTGMPAAVAIQYAQSVVDQFTGDTLSKVGNRYKIRSVKTKTASDHVTDLKDIMRRAGLSPDN